MGTLRKRQYETFCYSYVRFPNAGEAAEDAGYSYQNRHQQGYRLLRRPQIQRRIRELREELAAHEAQSVGVLLAKLETSFKRAIKDGNCYAAVRVLELQAKLNGFIAGRPTGKGDDGENAASGEPPQLPAGPSDEARRAALTALVRSSARKRARLSTRA